MRITDPKGRNPSISKDPILEETIHSSDSVVDSKEKKKNGALADYHYGKNTVSTPEKISIRICRVPEAVVYDTGTGIIHSDLLGL